MTAAGPPRMKEPPEPRKRPEPMAPPLYLLLALECRVPKITRRKDRGIHSHSDHLHVTTPEVAMEVIRLHHASSGGVCEPSRSSILGSRLW